LFNYLTFIQKRFKTSENESFNEDHKISHPDRVKNSYKFTNEKGNSQPRKQQPKKECQPLQKIDEVEEDGTLLTRMPGRHHDFDELSQISNMGMPKVC